MKMADLPGTVYGWSYWDRDDMPKVPQTYARKSRAEQLAKGRLRAQRSYEKRRDKILLARALKRGVDPTDFAPKRRGRYTVLTAGMADRMESPILLTTASG
jgi:hypothetical protein